jgi:hypothetical protein
MHGTLQQLQLECCIPHKGKADNGKQKRDRMFAAAVQGGNGTHMWHAACSYTLCKVMP